MAIRQIRLAGDPILSKPCKEVKQMTPMLQTLVNDMLETMYEANGVGLAAPQVGILRRIVVIDVGEEGEAFVLINPEIIEQEGEELADEGCLSLPGKAGQVARPTRVVVRAKNEDMEEFELEAEGLLARAICHECDHLEGHMYTELVVGDIHEVSYEDEDQAEQAKQAKKKERKKRWRRTRRTA